MTRKIVMLAYTVLAVMSANVLAANTAHKLWDVQDKDVRRAVWLWNSVEATRYNQIPGNESSSDRNRYWDMADPANPQPHEKVSERFWDNYKGIQDLLLDYYANKSINTVYLSHMIWQYNPELQAGEIPRPDDLAAFVRKANAKNIKVWGLFYLWDTWYDENGNKQVSLDYMGDHENGEHISVAETIMDAVGRYNQAYPDAGLVGVQNDQEPKSLDLLVPLIEFAQAATDRSKQWNASLTSQGARPFIFSQTYRSAYIKTQKVTFNGVRKFASEHLLDVSDHAAFMDYTDNASKFKGDGELLLAQADAASGDKRVVLGTEVNDLHDAWPDSEYETWYEEIEAEGNNTRFNEFEAAMDNAESSFMTYDSYERIAIHSSLGYFKHWFRGDAPNDIADEHDSAGTTWNPSVVDLTQDASPWATDVDGYLPGENPGSGGGSGSSNLFSDDFENGSLVTGGWTNAGSGVTEIALAASYNSTYGARVKNGAILTKTLSTLGYDNVSISYDRNTLNFAGSENLTVQWSVDGSNWTTLEVTQSSSWANKQFNLPSAANNQTQLTIQFATNGNRNAEKAFIDNVIVSAEVAEGEPTPELLTNKGFEDGNTFWQYWIANRVSNNARTGSYAGEVSSGGDIKATVTGLKANTTYTLSAYLKTSGKIGLYVRNYGGTKLSTTTTSSGYTKKSLTFTTGATDTSAEIYVYGASGTSYVDDWDLVEQ
ncbi:carbohydrate binding domain-containing protein [Thalassotalea sp. PLHSN55]|uniref:carbohydrate binding domain-containing protein n=1 Tax=Thalassotalea sp. PLHSN55 TaxID=3435888 RepID=UPI003F83265A